MRAHIYVIGLEGVGLRIGLYGMPTEDLSEPAGHLRTVLVRTGFENRDICVFDLSGLSSPATWSSECQPLTFTRRGSFFANPFTVAYVESAGASCLNNLARDPAFETESLAIVAVSNRETNKRLEASVQRSLRGGPWPIATPRSIETFHVVDDSLVMWWGFPQRQSEIGDAIAGAAEHLGLPLRIATARSRQELADKFFIGPSDLADVGQ